MLIPSAYFISADSQLIHLDECEKKSGHKYCRALSIESHLAKIMLPWAGEVFEGKLFACDSVYASFYDIIMLFRVVKTTLSSSYNISGLIPVCWLLFQCF